MTPEEISTLVTRQVKSGMWFLDYIAPGWHKRINTSILDISSDDNCIWGQLFGSIRQVHEFGMVVAPRSIKNMASDLGFMVYQHSSPEYKQALTQEWRQQIEARLIATA